MRKENPARFSSAVGEAWMHCEFKVRYCHKIFDDEIYREATRLLILESAYDSEIPIGEIGFDENHVHFMADIGNYTRPQVAKILKGPTAKHFFESFPELKRSKCEGGLFWNSGLWNPSYYIGSPQNLASTINYIRKQKYGGLSVKNRAQKTLASFAS